MDDLDQIVWGLIDGNVLFSKTVLNCFFSNIFPK